MSRQETRRESGKLNTRRKSDLKERKKINRQSMLVTIFFSIIFCCLVGYYAYFIIHDSKTVVKNSYNRRIDQNAESVIRGTIYSRGGKKLAYTNLNGTEDDLSDDTRKYPYGKTFAHVIGITTHGKYGLEKLCNYDLLSTEEGPLQKIINDFSNATEKGCDVYTTFNVSMQKTAYESLGDNKGAAVAINPDTGEIYAMTSKPSYDPETIDDIWDELANDSSDSRLLNRATQGKYIPGSVFKVVTTLAYIASIGWIIIFFSCSHLNYIANFLSCKLISAIICGAAGFAFAQFLFPAKI